MVDHLLVLAAVTVADVLTSYKIPGGSLTLTVLAAVTVADVLTTEVVMVQSGELGVGGCHCSRCFNLRRQRQVNQLGGCWRLSL